MQERLQSIADDFALFDDWEERYRYLIDMGRSLPKLQETERVEANIVQGCTSQVWMVSEPRDGQFYFRADSDAHIVRGLIALLHKIYNDIAVDELASVDIEEFFMTIGLDQHLSPNRRNGFFSIVEKIKAYAH